MLHLLTKGFFSFAQELAQGKCREATILSCREEAAAAIIPPRGKEATADAAQEEAAILSCREEAAAAIIPPCRKEEATTVAAREDKAAAVAMQEKATTVAAREEEASTVAAREEAAAVATRKRRRPPLLRRVGRRLLLPQPRLTNACCVMQEAHLKGGHIVLLEEVLHLLVEPLLLAPSPGCGCCSGRRPWHRLFPRQAGWAVRESRGNSTRFQADVLELLLGVLAVDLASLPHEVGLVEVEGADAWF